MDFATVGEKKQDTEEVRLLIMRGRAFQRLKEKTAELNSSSLSAFAVRGSSNNELSTARAGVETGDTAVLESVQRDICSPCTPFGFYYLC